MAEDAHQPAPDFAAPDQVGGEREHREQQGHGPEAPVDVGKSPSAATTANPMPSTTTIAIAAWSPRRRFGSAG
jgi:hypothetical protein